MSAKRTALICLLIFALSFSAAADEIVLNNGDSYQGELLNESLKVRTDFAEFELQSDFLLQADRQDEQFDLNLKKDNSYLAQILSELQFKTSSRELKVSPSQLKSLSLKSRDQYSSQSNFSLTTINEDYFTGNFVEESIRIKSDLNSAFELKLKDIAAIERLDSQFFLFSLRDGRELKAQFAQKTIIIWPTAAELIEFDLGQLQKMDLNE